MVRLTIIGRVRDGLPLAQGHRYINEENYSYLIYKKQAEFLLEEISRGSLSASQMTIRVDSHSFHYLVENGVCFITISDFSYPRKLAFHYLQDQQKELDKFDNGLVEKITKPYSFVKFNSIISTMRKQYIDTRTQANLSKMKANRRCDVNIITKQMCNIMQRRQFSEISERQPTTLQPVSPIWGSPQLEVIALKWTPITIIIFVALFLLLANLILTDDYLISTV